MSSVAAAAASVKSRPLKRFTETCFIEIIWTPPDVQDQHVVVLRNLLAYLPFLLKVHQPWVQPYAGRLMYPDWYARSWAVSAQIVSAILFSIPTTATLFGRRFGPVTTADWLL